MDKKIDLYWKNYLLLHLYYDGQFYIQDIELDKLKCALAEDCPIDFLFNTKIEKVVKTTYLPPVFDEFNFSDAREDLLNEYGIQKTDTTFEKLYKVAQKPDSILNDGFWICINKNDN